MLPDALAIALLGAIESLLSAVVADGMTGRRHRSNCELVAQGVANIGSALFGGICVTGTIARTATNVRAGARGPIAGHAPCALSAAVHGRRGAARVVCPACGARRDADRRRLEHGGKDEFVALIKSSRGDALVLLATFLLTVFVDLLTAIGVGVVPGSFLFLHRMAEAVEVEGGAALIDDRADADDVATADGMKGDVFVFRISGALFFGATAGVGTILDRIGEHPRVFILDFSAVPLIDSTGAQRAAWLCAQAAAVRHQDLFQRRRRQRPPQPDQRRAEAAGRALQRQHRKREGGRARGFRLTRPTPAPPAG